ncbi:conserved hypothetical protein [Candidatus Desulfarcum epimagneticum]|uniref:Rubrerythrin rubredoxin-like domain-containing protein n=1 Tax=uncultured Desulfobacteraceae bacterium TaxID=218296 RepID=A0A484HHV0_9BACT|nr:conserved hypothetical protein [uncultured Desulfobacteraceae bacterium]
MSFKRFFTNLSNRMASIFFDAVSNDPRRHVMGSWKCSKCGYMLEKDAPPEQCPSCKEKCEFLDNSCYTPDCSAEGVDKRI